MPEHRLIDVVLDERSIIHRSANIEHERKVAVFDLLEENRFAPVGSLEGPYILHLSIEEDRLVFEVHDAADAPLTRFNLPTATFRKLIREYFTVCESYFEAIRSASPSRIEAIDMGRRGLHDEGTEMLRERLAGKVDLDFATARRLFTLMCVLHIRG